MLKNQRLVPGVIKNGVEPMRYRNNSGIFELGSDRLLNQIVSFQVDGCCRFVQNKWVGLTNSRPMANWGPRPLGMGAIVIHRSKGYPPRTSLIFFVLGPEALMCPRRAPRSRGPSNLQIPIAPERFNRFLWNRRGFASFWKIQKFWGLFTKKGYAKGVMRPESQKFHVKF